MLGLAFRRMRRARVSSLLLVALYALAALFTPMAGPAYGAGATWIGAAVPLAAVLIEIGIVHRLVADMAGQPARVAGLSWFYVGALLATVPLIASLALLQLPGLADGAAITALACVMLGGFAIILLLQAWPVALAARRGWVSPLRVLRATRGHRHHLLFALILLGVLAGLPEAEPMRPFVEQMGLGALRFAGNALTTLLLAGLASAAYDAACANDPGLRGSAIPD